MGGFTFFLGNTGAYCRLTTTILQLGSTDTWRGLTDPAITLDESVHVRLETAVIEVIVCFSGAAFPGQTDPMGNVDQGGGWYPVALVVGAPEISSDNDWEIYKYSITEIN